MASGDTGGVIRSARPAEAALLSDLAFRSKAHWGYDDAFMESCRDELALSPEQIHAHPVFVLEVDDAIVGFYSLEARPDGAVELNHLFVEPGRIGRGEGSALFGHALATAGAAGFRRLVIQSDPNAAGFYRARGASAVGERPSDSIPGRMLPLFEVSLRGDALTSNGASVARSGRASTKTGSGRGH